MDFIEVTPCDEGGKTYEYCNKSFINVDEIVMVENYLDDDGNSFGCIYVSCNVNDEDDSYYVKETADEVMEKINRIKNTIKI